MALRAGNSALHWTATRPEDNTPATAVAVGHFVQVGIPPLIRAERPLGRIKPWICSGWQRRASDMN
jgi:hypothetical protein